MTSFVRAAGLGALSLMLLSTAASADMGLRGSLDADYNNISGDNDIDGDLWNFNANVVLPLGTGFNVQGGFGYHTLDVEGIGGDAWDIRGAAFWREAWGDIGASIDHLSVSPDDNFVSDDFDITAYGAFGEFFASDNFTISAQGGWLNGDFDVDGHYYGAGLKFYIMPTLSIAGNADRIHLDSAGHVTDLNATIEWQVMADKPFTVYGAYTNTDFSGTDFNTDTFSIGVRWRFGEDGAMSLVDGDRTNAVRNTSVNWGSAFTF